MQRKEPSKPISTSIALGKVTQAGEWMVENKNILLSVGCLGICGYQILSSIIYGLDITPVENPASLYSWFDENTARLGITDLLSTLVKNSYPVTQHIFKDIALGVAAGVVQLPLAVGAMLIQNNIPLSEVKIGTPKEANETYLMVTISNAFSLFHEFAERNIFMTGLWCGLVRWGMPSSYAITGSVVMNSIWDACSGHEKGKLSNFVSGLYLSGLTLFSQGNLIPSTVSEITKNTLGTFVQVPLARK